MLGLCKAIITSYAGQRRLTHIPIHARIHMPEILQHFARNTHGRDFVVGDIHGCFDLLQQALDEAAFNPDRDRLFSVGDLIDRGPQSPQVLLWLSAG